MGLRWSAAGIADDTAAGLPLAAGGAFGRWTFQFPPGGIPDPGQRRFGHSQMAGHAPGSHATLALDDAAAGRVLPRPLPEYSRIDWSLAVSDDSSGEAIGCVPCPIGKRS